MYGMVPLPYVMENQSLKTLYAIFLTNSITSLNGFLLDVRQLFFSTLEGPCLHHPFETFAIKRHWFIHVIPTTLVKA